MTEHDEHPVTTVEAIVAVFFGFLLLLGVAYFAGWMNRADPIKWEQVPATTTQP